MKIGLSKEKTVYITYQLGAYGVMERGSLGKEVIALLRVSRSRRVIVVKVEEKSGSDQGATFTWLERVSPQAYIRVPEKENFDLYVDSEGDKVQA